MSDITKYLLILGIVFTNAYSGVYTNTLRYDLACEINNDLGENFSISRNIFGLTIAQLYGTVANLDNDEDCFIFFNDVEYRGTGMGMHYLTSSAIAVANAMEDTDWEPSCLLVIFSNLMYKINSYTLYNYLYNKDSMSDMEVQAMFLENAQLLSNIQFVN